MSTQVEAIELDNIVDDDKESPKRFSFFKFSCQSLGILIIASFVVVVSHFIYLTVASVLRTLDREIQTQCMSYVNSRLEE